MSRRSHVRTRSAPWLTARGLLRWIGTSNPFYVLSAGLFLAGLWMSFRAQDGDVETWSLTLGLGGYTLLLAVTGCLLVRFGNVWDDVRTVLLLAVLMFLATSITFDEALVLQPQRGALCFLLGFAFTVTISEGMLRGAGLILRPLFRIPYYLILGLFFLYPLALRPLIGAPHSPAALWGLFAFSTVAGVIFLTLLPAIRQGRAYAEDNGSPWHWPLYPWVLFGVLAAAVPARAYMLCGTMHLLTGREGEHMIFGPYFVVPFGLAVCILLLEAAIVSGHRIVKWAALAGPGVLIKLAVAAHRPDPVYQEFFDLFTATLGGDPLYITMLAVACFYAYAAARRVSAAVEMLSASLVSLAFIGPTSLENGGLLVPQPVPLLLAALIQVALGLWRRQSARFAIGLGGLAFVATLIWPEPNAIVRVLIAYHLALVGMLIVGAEFDDLLARMLRSAGTILMLLNCLAALLWGNELTGVPGWFTHLYPLALACGLGIYGLLLGRRLPVTACLIVLSCWCAGVTWWCYHALRLAVAGLDYIAISLALFALALLISLGKSGLLLRWLGNWRRRPMLEESETA